MPAAPQAGPSTSQPSEPSRWWGGAAPAQEFALLPDPLLDWTDAWIQDLNDVPILSSVPPLDELLSGELQQGDELLSLMQLGTRHSS